MMDDIRTSRSVSEKCRQLPAAPWPARCTVLGIALLPVQFGTDGSTVRWAPSDVLFGAAAVLLLMSARAPARRLLWLWAALFAVVTLAVVTGSARGTMLESAMVDRWLGCLGLLFAAFSTSALDAARIGRGLRGASWVAVAAHVVVVIDPSVTVSRIAGRNAGFLVDPNNAGVMVAALLVVELSRAVESLRIGRRVGWSHAVLMGGLAWALVETGSRTGWAALAAGLVTVLVLNRDHLLMLVHRRVLRFAAFTIALVVGLRTAFVAQFDELQFRPDNVARRSEVFERSWRSFVESPLSGGGLMHTQQLGFGFPHSSLLWLLGDAGVLGLAAFAAIVVVPLTWLTRQPRRERTTLWRPVACALATMTVASIGIEALYQRQWWVFIGAAAGLSTTRAAAPSVVAAGRDTGRRLVTA